MKSLLAVVLMLTAAHASAGEIQTVPALQWLHAAVTGKPVSIKYGGQLREIGRENGRVLARYVKRGAGGGASEADVGDLVWIDAGEFDTMTERYNERVAAKRAEVELVRKLLEQER